MEWSRSRLAYSSTRRLRPSRGPARRAYTHERALGPGIRDDQVGRRLEVTVIANQLPATQEIAVRVFDFPVELSLLIFQGGCAAWRVEHRLAATTQFSRATAFRLSCARVQGDECLGREFVDHPLGRLAPQRAQSLQKLLPVLVRDSPCLDHGAL